MSRKLGGRGDDRDAFVKRVEEWKTECESGIRGQLSRLGLAFDWERFVWTLDEKRSAAVDEAFVRLFEQGKIYRRERLVNWCVALSTVLSDVEVETVERDGEMYRFRYPLVEGAAQEFLPVMTTRPETIWGDTAVAVHPQDERFNVMQELIWGDKPDFSLTFVVCRNLLGGWR